MHKTRHQDGSTGDEQLVEHTVDLDTGTTTCSRARQELARAVPRLREIATQAILLAPIIGLTPEWWGGGRGGGC